MTFDLIFGWPLAGLSLEMSVAVPSDSVWILTMVYWMNGKMKSSKIRKGKSQLGVAMGEGRP
jgi:hypothetical protein